MTVNTTLSRVSQNGDGTSHDFTVPYYFLQDDDLLVYVDGQLQTLTTDYTVSGAGNAGGGTISFATPPFAGSGNVVIIRDPDLLQATNYPANDPFPARTHETALDKLTMLVQRTRDLIGRAFTLADGDTSHAALTVPTPQPGYLIGWNENGSGLANFAGTGGASTLPLPVSVANGGTGAASATAARGNLGLGSAAILNTGAAPGNVVQLDGSARLPAVNGSQLTNLTLPAPPVVVPVRQTVLGGATDANGYASWLSTGSGLAVNVAATTAPVRLAFASGYTDLIADLAADAANQFGALPANNTSFLYADRVNAGAIAGGSTLVAPQYGNTFDRTKAALLHFEGSNGATSTTDDWGNTVSLTGCALSTAQSRFGAAALLISSGQYADLGITAMASGSWCFEAFIRRASSGALAVIFEATNANSLGVRLYFNASNFLAVDLSGTGSSNDIGTITGTSAVAIDNLWHHVAAVYDNLAGKYFLYLDGVSQGTPIASNARICAIGGMRIGGTRANGLSNFIGHVDEFRYGTFCPYPNGTTFTPPASAFTVSQAGQAACWFDIPNMTMREVTGPSTSAGSSPVLTTRTRLFVGEADAAASSIATVRNYAYQARYRSPLTAIPAASTVVALASLLGVDPQFVTAKAWLRFVGQWNGYPSGMVVPFHAYYSGTNPPFFEPVFLQDRNTVALAYVSAVYALTNYPAISTYVNIPSGGSVAQFFIEAHRGF